MIHQGHLVFSHPPLYQFPRGFHAKNESRDLHREIVFRGEIHWPRLMGRGQHLRTSLRWGHDFLPLPVLVGISSLEMLRLEGTRRLDEVSSAVRKQRRKLRFSTRSSVMLCFFTMLQSSYIQMAYVETRFISACLGSVWLHEIASGST